MDTQFYLILRTLPSQTLERGDHGLSAASRLAWPPPPPSAATSLRMPSPPHTGPCRQRIAGSPPPRSAPARSHCASRTELVLALPEMPSVWLAVWRSVKRGTAPVGTLVLHPDAIVAEHGAKYSGAFTHGQNREVSRRADPSPVRPPQPAL